MKQRFAIAVLMVLGLCAIALAGTDLSGTWVLDRSRSDQPQMGRQGGGGGGQGGGQRGEMTVTLAIKQSTNDLVITRKVSRGGQDMPPVDQKYTLDGKENKNTPQFGGRGGEGRTREMITKSKWNGATLVIEGNQKMSTPNGDFDIGIKNEYALSEGGKTLTITSTRSQPDGDRTTKQVYTKK